jgi:L-asparaginase
VKGGPWDGLILETFGSGNIPQKQWMQEELKNLIDQGTVIVNVSQCTQGYIDQNLYHNAQALEKLGVIGGGDMTTESAITKLMYVLGQYQSLEERKKNMRICLSGEFTVN